MSKLKRGDIIKLTHELTEGISFTDGVMFPPNLVTEIVSIIEYMVVNNPHDGDIESQYPNGETAYLRLLKDPDLTLKDLNGKNWLIPFEQEKAKIKKVTNKVIKFTYHMIGPFVDD